MHSLRIFNHRMAAAALLVASLVFTAAACSKEPGGPDGSGSLNGQWAGNAPDGFGSSITVNALLAENASALTGSGSVIAYGLNCAHSLQGTRTGMNFSVNFTCPGIEPVNFAGTISSNGRSLSGALNGSGFSNFAFTMNKN
jgi:hypothetical protein